MRRSLALGVVAFALVGCQQAAPPGQDPFFGYTRVTPPPTGAAGIRAPDPFYAGAPAAGTPTAGVPGGYYPSPGAAASPASGWPPPGNYAGGNYATGAPTMPSGGYASPPSYPPPYVTGTPVPGTPVPGTTGYSGAPNTGYGGRGATGQPAYPASQPGTNWTPPATAAPPGGFSPFTPPSGSYRGASVAPAYETNAAGSPVATAGSMASMASMASTNPTASAASTGGAASSNSGSLVRIVESPPARPLGSFVGATTDRAAPASSASVAAAPTRPLTTDPSALISGQQPIVRTLPPRPADATAAPHAGFPYAAPGAVPASPTTSPGTSPAAAAPSRAGPPAGTINLKDLPDAAANEATPSGGSMRWVSAARPADGAAPAESDLVPVDIQRTAYVANAPWGYDTNYQWLRGQLEYVPQERAWRVNYIPPFSTPDRLGGRLTIANPQSLSGLERGELVEVRGRLRQQWSHGAIGTVYEVAQATRLANPGQ